MKATILNGMQSGDSLCEAAQQALVDLLEERGWQVETFVLHRRAIRPCVGCFGCWTKTPGKCVMDDTDDIAKAFINSDLAVLLTPVIFGSYSSELKKAVDHLIPGILPFFMTVDGETHHKKRYKSYPKLLAVGAMRQRDEEIERLFTRVVQRNAINMHSPVWVAGTVSPERANGQLRAELLSMLRKAGVTQ